MAPTIDQLLSDLSLAESHHGEAGDVCSFSEPYAMGIDNDEHPVELQRQCKLLSHLPSEIRVQIWTYMTISPKSEECIYWKGAYLACRQMHSEIRTELKPCRDLVRIRSRVLESQPRWDLQPSQSFTLFGLLQEFTVSIPLAVVNARYLTNDFEDTLVYLYQLHLNRLVLNLTGGWAKPSPYVMAMNDVKDLDGDLVREFVDQGEVKCKEVTISIEHLVKADGGRTKSTALDIVSKRQGILYTMIIVQDKDENQVERTYSLPNRLHREASVKQ